MGLGHRRTPGVGEGVGGKNLLHLVFHKGADCPGEWHRQQVCRRWQPGRQETLDVKGFQHLIGEIGRQGGLHRRV